MKTVPVMANRTKDKIKDKNKQAEGPQVLQSCVLLDCACQPMMQQLPHRREGLWIGSPATYFAQNVVV
jgi:hypothetical protein